MNQQQANENENNGTDQQLEEQLEELTTTLENLQLQREQLRRQSDRVEASITRIRREQQRRSLPAVLPPANIRRDRHGDQIDIGDYINFLTTSRFNSHGGTVTGISHRRFVSARDRRGRIINREPTNVEIVRKYFEHHDRRRRL